LRELLTLLFRQVLFPDICLSAVLTRKKPGKLHAIKKKKAGHSDLQSSSTAMIFPSSDTSPAFIAIHPRSIPA